MSKMSDEELRELLDKYIAPAWLQKRHKTTEVPSYDLHLDEAMRAIHSYTQEKCREARVDELTKLDATTDANGNPLISQIVYGVMQERIAQLNKSKGENK